MPKSIESPKTVYTVKGRNFLLLLEFTYGLDGFLHTFTVLDGELTERFRSWLFSSRFPYKESLIESWRGIKNIEVTVGKPDFTFETFYNLYGYKMSPKPAEKAWNRTSKANQLLAIKSIKAYKGFLKRSNQAQAYPATYLNKEIYKSQFNSY